MKDFLFHVKCSLTGEPKDKKTYGVVAVKIIAEEVWFVIVEGTNSFKKIPAVICTFEGFGKKKEK